MSEKITHLELLKGFPHRQLLEEELKGCLEEVEREIFEERQREVKYTYDDILKRERKVLKMLIDLPDTLISDIKTGIIEEKDE